MNVGVTVQTLKPAAGDACRVLRDAWYVGRARTPHPAPGTPHSALRTPHSRRAFTLIEIMIVVAIMGVVMTMSVPIVYKVWRKAPMRKAVGDTVEVFSVARRRAIMSGAPTEVILHPRDNRLGVTGAASPPHSAADDSGGPGPDATPASGSSSSAQLPAEVIIETLDINMSGIEYNDAEEARIRFYPNGISDEMRMILFDGRDRMGIELEITTGLANVVPDPLREWMRR